MMEKKLKDLKIGDRVWIYDFTDTTPITTIKKKREGELMKITLKWDDSEYECFGPALGWTCVGYDRKFGRELVFSSSYNKAIERENRKKRISNFISNTKKFIQENENVIK